MRYPDSSAARLAGLALLSIALFAPAPAEAQRAEGSFRRTLTVSGIPDIEISAGSGRIEVQAGSSGRVEITAQVRAGDWGGRWFNRGGLSPQERVRRVEANPPVQQSGNSVRIGYFTDDDWRNGVSISYVVTVPAPSTLIARTGSGSQQIDGVNGRVDAHSGSGSLTLRGTGALTASTGSGSITAQGVGGDFSATAGSGSISATAVSGAIRAKTGSGGIDLEQTGGGNVDVSSGSGTVRVRGVRGSLDASTASGGLIVQGELAGDWRLSASSGSVEINLPRNQGFELDANTGSGSIDVDFPVTVTGRQERRALRGSAQGGGPLLRVRTGSGGISIQKRT